MPANGAYVHNWAPTRTWFHSSAHPQDRSSRIVPLTTLCKAAYTHWDTTNRSDMPEIQACLSMETQEQNHARQDEGEADPHP